MSFLYDENNVGLEPIKAGTYEVYPSSWVKEMSSNGNDMITMNYTIRDDIDQPSAGNEIKYDYFTDTKNAAWRFNSLTKATQAFQNNHDFGDIAHWAEAMLGKPITVDLKLEKGNNGKEFPKIKAFKAAINKMNVKPVVKYHGDMNQQSEQNMSSQPAQQSDPFADNQQKLDITDDDLPF